MPDVNWNKNKWDLEYNWRDLGEEWSSSWGNSETQWFGCIYSRIHRFLPSNDVLEIAPGFGRWTKYIINYAKNSYIGVDLCEKCIDFCKKEFIGEKNKFYKNDGFDLSMISDQSCDFVFSFDSLVHAEINVFEFYIPQIIKKLKNNGLAFIHHSNWLQSNEKENKHKRAESVGIDKIRLIIEKENGHTIIQETLNWGSQNLIDAFTLFSKKDRINCENTIFIKNVDFNKEIDILKKVHNKYCIT